MADKIICPVCGETNPADMEFCRNCQSRLKPLTGSLQGENAPIQPGELPTRKVTSELEPLLPQWLRDARQQARSTGTEDKSQSDPESKKEFTPASGSDFLAGLASQGDEEEEIPDWLAHITGAASKKKKPVPDENQVKWVELGHEPQQPSLDEESSTPPEAQPPAAHGSDRDELTDWFKQAAPSGAADLPWSPAQQDTGSPASFAEEPPAAQSAEPEEDLSWIKRLDAAASTGSAKGSEVTPPAREESPDWLKKLQAEQAPPEPPPTAAQPPSVSPADVPEWLKTLHTEQAPVEPPENPAQPPSAPPAEIPDWLKSFGSEASLPASTPSQEQPSAHQAVPDWLQGISPSTPDKPAQESSMDAPPIVGPTDLPNWMPASEAGQDSRPITPQEQTAAEGAALTEPPDWASPSSGVHESQEAAGGGPKSDGITSSTELPDWVSSLRGSEQPSSPPSESAKPALELNEPNAAVPTDAPQMGGAAFAPDALSVDDVDAIFASMQTPDWLSAVLPSTPSPEENVPAAQQEEEPIGPADLPSWVQAMRPVEAAMGTLSSVSENIIPEERGPLAGLQGVLPAIPGAAAPSSKPKSHSIKLDATEQQLAHAVLLEQILAAETSPVPMKSGALLRTQRVLRWAVSWLLLLVLGGTLFSGTQIFALPSGVPSETVAAINAVESIPTDATVLVVFDYQPSTVGEMEATSASLLDHLLLLKHPRLVLVSTIPTGPALAERLMSTALASRAYARDQQYVDIGYIPGGLAGVHNFAQSPSATVPLDARSRPIWQSAILAPVRTLSDFSAIILLTDTVESGRTWVEQTTTERGNTMMIIVASAQAGPMLLPYVDSGQVNGMVSGIYGAVGTEQRNAGAPGFIRHYWDAYSAGLYLAVLLILLGGLWSFWLGLRDRRAQAVG